MIGEMWPADDTLQWRLVTDSVMGGVSRGTMRREPVHGRDAIRMQGDVSLDNDGGFIQIALDLAMAGQVCDARAFTGIAIDVCGNRERYGAHLRGADTTRPQQSWRSDFVARPEWETIAIPFADFAPHRIDLPLDVSRLRRLGIVAIGRTFAADIAVARLAFY